MILVGSNGKKKDAWFTDGTDSSTTLEARLREKNNGDDTSTKAHMLLLGPPCPRLGTSEQTKPKYNNISTSSLVP